MQIQYLAGLYEGEGSFGTNGRSKAPLLRIGMTDKDVIDTVQVLMPGGYRYDKHDSRNSNKTVYYYHLSGPVAAIWMRRLRPYLGERRQARIDQILAAYEPKIWPEKSKDRLADLFWSMATGGI